MLSRERVTEERLAALLGGWVDEEDEGERELGQVLHALRRDTPPAPEALRERVRTVAAAGPVKPAPTRERPRLRRGLVVIAFAVIVASLGSAFVYGIVSSGGGGDDAGSGGGEAAQVAPAAGGAEGAPAEGAERDVAPATGGETGLNAPEATSTDAARAQKNAPNGAATLPPSGRRVQDYRVSLRVRVEDADDLSRRTKAALRLTRNFGGYVVAVNYGVGREGDANLVLRVPIGRVQDAVFRFSELGTILAQQVSIQDLQGRIDAQSAQIERLTARVAEIREALRDPSLDELERFRLEAELEQAQRTIAALRGDRAGLVREGRYAKVSLALTTRAGAITPPAEPSRIERALSDAWSVLAKEIAIGIYVLIVAAPFLLLAALAYAGVRAGRRRADQRLLERA